MSSKQTDVPLDFGDKDRIAIPATQPARGKASAWHKSAVTRLLNVLGNPAIVVRLWDGTRITTSDREPVGSITFTAPHVIRRIAMQQDVGFGDGYSSGDVLVDGDLVEVLIAIDVAREKARSKSGLLDIANGALSRRTRLNTLAGSKQNIHHHYDIGNRFYQAWLDEEMQYTCAYFPQEGMTLEQAQQAKMDHVCRKLQLQPGQTVVEAGCGWGGLARYMAQNYDVSVKAYNISHEQVLFAREKARALGLSDRVEYIEDDYREITGQYDAFVSVGMLEHVGSANYAALGDVINRCLSPSGRGLIHTIGRNKPRLMNRWIEKRIFPGAYPPTLSEMMDIFEPSNFAVTDVENLRLHYATTLRHWLGRFEDSVPEIRDEFDDRFLRAWRLYLSGSISAFLTSSLQLFQVAFSRGEDNSVPWSRDHMYLD